MSKPNEGNWTNRLRALGFNGKLPGALTDAVVAAARRKAQGTRYVLADGRVPGLSLCVGASGTTVFWLHYRTRGGVRRRYKIGSAGGVALDAARALAMGVLAEVARGTDPAAQKRADAQNAKTVRSYLEDVYEPQKLKHRKANNGAIAKAHILAAWAPLLDVPLSALTREKIEKVLTDRKAELRADGSRKVKDGTLLRGWSGFRAMLAHAVDRGYLAAMPTPRRPEPLRGLHDEPRIRWIGQHDAEDMPVEATERARFTKALEAHASKELGGGDFLRCVVQLALATGMRRGEIVRLTASMINTRERTITLPASVTKSNKTRVVFINDAASAALRLWTLRGTRGELFPGDGEPDQVAERWEDRITQREWPRLCEVAGVVDLHLHDCRHDFAVRLLRSGATMEQVRDALGHASVATTEKHYAHVMPSDVRRAVLGLRAG